MVGPDARLLGAVAVWTAAAVAAVVAPVLWPLLAAALVGLAALVLWDAVLLRRTPLPQCERVLPARAFAGRAAEVCLRLHNPGRAVVICDVFDEAPADVRLEATGTALRQAQGERTIDSRMRSVPFAPSLSNGALRERHDPVFRAVHLDPGAAVALTYSVVPTRRGERPFGSAVILARSPLGWLRRRLVCAAGAALRVYPDAARFLRPEALQPQRVLLSIGVRPQRQRGEGMDFAALRDYLPGDDPRRVDWKATARRGRLVVRQYQHEANHTVIIAVDASRLMAGEVDGRSKLDHAVDAALALAYAALTTGDRVGLVVFDREVVAYLAPRAHRHHFGACLELLQPIQPRLVEADHHALLRWVNARHRQRALVVVLTDFVEAGATAFRAPLALLARRHRVVLVAVRDRVYRLLDAGGGTADPLDLYRRVVLDDLLRQRETALAVLRRGGAQTLDLAPEAITGAVLNRYLALRHGPDR
jgi:uncharacterized protein (DUF58 family)